MIAVCRHPCVEENDVEERCQGKHMEHTLFLKGQGTLLKAENEQQIEIPDGSSPVISLQPRSGRKSLECVCKKPTCSLEALRQSRPNAALGIRPGGRAKHRTLYKAKLITPGAWERSLKRIRVRFM